MMENQPINKLTMTNMLASVSQPTTTTTPNTTNSSTSASTSTSTSSSTFAISILRCFLLDIPLMVLFAAYIGMVLLEQVHSNYLIPLKAAMEFTDIRRDVEVTYYHYTCTPLDITASNADELVSHDGAGADDAMDKMQRHGATILPNLLSNTTTLALRNFILQENTKQEGFWVIEGNQRYSFGITVDQDPSVTAALTELGRHRRLTAILHKLVGRNPAVIEFTAITSTYGAAVQHFHQDVVPEGSAAKYARSFIPSYSLFIPLQDTSSQMGATELCAGTQLCANDVTRLCDEYAFQASTTSQGVWPQGWGALVNQQTTHRGTAHNDPTPGHERVVFILTLAPRPQYHNKVPGVVESRLIGSGGSYSLQWSQWGHTWQDFTSPKTRMRQPWRTLRAVGLYKPRSADWGWDWTSVALMRMANGDNGYTRDTLEQFVWEDGGIAFLPRWLQAPIAEDFYNDEEEEEEEEEDPDAPRDGGWHDFFVATAHNVKRALALWNQVAMGIFGLGLVVVSLRNAMVSQPKQRLRAGLSTLASGLRRVLLTHGSVLVVAWLLLQRVHNSYWARHIRNGKLFQPYNITRELFVSEADEDNSVDDDNDNDENFIPFTLPNRNDVLINAHYQSRYFASYAHILDYNQAGNLIWREAVAANAHGFAQMTASLQEDFCDFLVSTVMLKRHRARFLAQTEGGRWSELGLKDSKSHCRQKLLMESNPLVKVLVQEIAFLRSETRFGAWREQALHRSIMPSYLSFWTETIVKLAAGGRPNENGEKQKRLLPEGATNSPFTSQPVLPIRTLASVPPRTVPTLLNWKTSSRMPLPWTLLGAREPFNGAWFKTGDIVEAKYQGIHNEWYRGILVDANTDRDTFDVLYQDGERDYDLCRRCIRRFEPYAVGEMIEARVEEGGDHFEPARIVAVYEDEEDDVYEIQFRRALGVGRHSHSRPTEIVKVSAADLRRTR